MRNIQIFEIDEVVSDIYERYFNLLMEVGYDSRHQNIFTSLEHLYKMWIYWLTFLLNTFLSYFRKMGLYIFISHRLFNFTPFNIVS